MVLKKGFWLFGFCLVIFIFFLSPYSKLQDLRQEKKELEEKIENLKKESLSLKEEKELLLKNKDSLEEVIREKMGVVKKDEIIYKIVPEE